ncbi:MAG: hypothetical protein ACFFDQ_00535 [Candidatus Thorarchaeota archaeon]
MHRKWLFYLTGLVCIALAVAGGLLYPDTQWGILAPVSFVLVVSLVAIGLLRLIYLKGLPE